MRPEGGSHIQKKNLEAYSVIGLVPTYPRVCFLICELSHVDEEGHRCALHHWDNLCYMYTKYHNLKENFEFFKRTWSRIEQAPSPTSIRMCKLTQVCGRGVGVPCATKSKVYRSSGFIWIVNVIARHSEVQGQLNFTVSLCEMLVQDRTGS